MQYGRSLRALGLIVAMLAMAGRSITFACHDGVDPLITEFMAFNTATLVDENGDYEDWIEIYNPCLPVVDLQGWYLTDDPSNLTKWRFPSVELFRGEFLLVFASGKDRAVSGFELHTNFALARQPAYLALVKPDGVTIAHEFSPLYPYQYDDVSYGYPQTASSLIVAGATATYRVPTSDDASIGTGWTATGFDDSLWETGTTGLGFTSGGAVAFEVSVYQANIDVSDLSAAEAVLSDPLTQDSVVTEFAAVINFLDTGSAGHFENDAPFPGFSIGDGVSDIVTLSTATVFIPTAGPWTFGVNSDDGFSLLLAREPWVFSSSFPSTRPAADTLAVFDIPEPGAYSIRLLQFQHLAAAGLELFAAEGNHASFSGAFRLIGDTANGGLELADIGSRIETDLASEMQGVNASLWSRLEFNVTDPNDLGLLVLGISFEDGFVAYLNGTQVASENAPDPALWDSTALSDRPNETAAMVERFDLSDSLYLMQAGTNVLAVHALNDAGADSDFLVLPELSAVEQTAGSATASYFPGPTPGFFNSPSGYPGLSATPFFSHPSSIFTDPFSVTLSAPSGAIRYTLDGSDPTETHGTVYDAPILVDTSRRIRARVFEAGFAPGPIVTRLYTMLDPDVVDFDSNLPIVVVNTFGGGLNKDWLTENLTGVIPTRSGRASISDPPSFVGYAGIRLRGSSSLGFPKKQYHLETWDENRQDLDTILLSFPSEADYILYAPYSDKALMRNVLAYSWSNAIGRYAVRTEFVEMFLQTGSGPVTSDDYVGVYVLMEKIKRDPNRVAITQLEPTDNAPPAVTGGYIVKKDRLDPGDVGFLTHQGYRLTYAEPKEEEITPAQSAYLTGFFDEFETALFGPDFTDPVDGYAKHIDADSFIDHHILVELTKNIDGYRLSSFMFKDREDRLSMGPIWDYNLSLGNANYLEGWLPEGWYYELIGLTNYPWYGRLFEDEAFRLRYADRWFAFRRGPFATTRLLSEIDNYAALLDESQVRNFVRWPVLGVYVWPNWFIASTYQEEIDWMKQWLSDRLDWIDSQFFAPPTFSLPAGSIPLGSLLTLDSPTGVIYYTFDGSDPRHPGGGISPAALGCPGPMLLTETTQIMARVWDNGTWSALNHAVFDPVPTSFVNEVLPLNLSVHADEEGDFDPWIELYNPSSIRVDLGGLYLTDDLAEPDKWSIPPGTTTCGDGRILIWADNEPVEGPLHATFTLDPAGGTVWLMNELGYPVDSLSYPSLTADVSYGRRSDGASLLSDFSYPTPGSVNPGPQTPIIVNEYNAVAPTKSLAGTDVFWGSAPGNGGDWFELVVVEDHLDLRGWQVVVEDGGGAVSTTLTFADAAILSDLRSGTILTISELLASDISYDPVQGDWWINLKSGSAGDALYVSALDFSVSNLETRLTVLDSAGDPVFGPAGEGIHPVSGVGNDEVFKLEEDPGPFVTPYSNYNDGTSSTFGAPNRWNGGAAEQRFHALRSVVAGACAGDPECDDDNPCTDDLCVAGFCENLENLATCDDGNPCTEGDRCGAGQCRGVVVGSCCFRDCECDDGSICTNDVCIANVCVNDPVPAGNSCDDGDPCTDGDECLEGGCAGTPVDCSGLDDECGSGTCSVSTGACEAQPINEGGPCDDGDLCTLGATCAGGFCGAPVDCSSLDDECHLGACDPGTGSCIAQMLADDTPCDADGDTCTVGDSCQGGVCVPGPAADCDDGNECTVDSCDMVVGCTQIPVDDGTVCDDAFLCTVDDQCTSGDCGGTESCPVGEVCRSDGQCTVPATLVFQHDGGYMGTHDTVIQEGMPNANNGDLDNWDWDLDQGSTQGETVSMIRFDRLICDTVRQIPQGSRIVSATLTVEMMDASAQPAGDIHMSNVDWDESLATWNNFGGDPGVQPDEIGDFVANAPFTLGAHDINVTSAVQAWADEPSANHGLLFLANSTNGGHVYSSEALDPRVRPKLTVELIATLCSDNGDCDDLLFCNGSEVCFAGVCQYGDPVDCDDGIACTSDLCNDTTSSCDNIPVDAFCDDGLACTTDSCIPGAGDCENTLEPGNCLIDAACYGDGQLNPLNDCEICVATTPHVWTPSEPREVEQLLLSHVDDETRLSWSGQGTGFVYDVVVANLADLLADGSVDAAFCLVDNLGTTTWVDPGSDPPVDEGACYLVRSQKSCGDGGYGTASGGADRLPASACP